MLLTGNNRFTVVVYEWHPVIKRGTGEKNGTYSQNAQGTSFDPKTLL
jgi:hypothetical protein